MERPDAFQDKGIQFDVSSNIWLIQPTFKQLGPASYLEIDFLNLWKSLICFCSILLETFMYLLIINFVIIEETFLLLMFIILGFFSFSLLLILLFFFFFYFVFFFFFFYFVFFLCLFVVVFLILIIVVVVAVVVLLLRLVVVVLFFFAFLFLFLFLFMFLFMFLFLFYLFFVRSPYYSYLYESELFLQVQHSVHGAETRGSQLHRVRTEGKLRHGQSLG